jgi:4-amino-4-deoxy-L-arabinose transferase-like glycosyltransferase
MKQLKRYLVNHRCFLILVALYFAVRSINLTLLPIFNDEAIYLDWGWLETHVPGQLYGSLYDNKPPLLMWIFGISETIFADPLFAGRIVSIFTGASSLLGIYLIAKTLFDKKTAILSTLLYVFIPLFVFFDRQALMESSIAATGIISCYFFIKLLISNKNTYAYLLGICLGLGFFIKTTALIFIVTYFIISFILLFKSKEKVNMVKRSGIVAIMIVLATLLLLINPQFWSTLSDSASRPLTVNEVLRFPFVTWINNAWANFSIAFFYITPLIFLFSIVGLYLLLKIKIKVNIVFALWIIISLFLQTIFVRATNQRYLVSYLPLTLIPAAYFLQIITEKKKTFGLFLLSFCLFLPCFLTFILIFQPPLYFSTMKKVNAYSQEEYLTGFTSGYGIIEVKNYIEQAAGNDKALVGLAINTGNPENAMRVYFRKNKQIIANYFDNRQFGTRLDGVDCIVSPVKFYFVSRNEEQAGLNRFFSKLKTFKNPYGNYSIGVYTFKKPCAGKSIPLQSLIIYD